ncbi:MAG: hypothetical protein BWY82_02889 [Verrucomicrobia bacterium ADurb.Bin474]|nr:MAG: hypothetical protein BWY82_02889 [Verrucomicrobia bacterium ADurb.Bin474]
MGFADRHHLVIKPGCFAVANEELVENRLMHHADDGLILVFEADHRAEERNPRGECLGPVDRIDDPDVVSVLVLVAKFLTDDAVLGIAVFNQAPDQAFRFPVRNRYGSLIGFPFGRDILLTEVAVDESATFHRQNLGEFHIL